MGAEYRIYVEGLTDGKRTMTTLKCNDGTTDCHTDTSFASDSRYGTHGRRTTTQEGVTAAQQSTYSMTLTTSTYILSTQYWIGRVEAEKFEGSISDVAFFPEALSDAQILQLDPSWEIQQSVPTLEADGSAVVINSDVAVPDGTYLMARIRLIDQFDERQWSAQFDAQKPEVVVCSPPFLVDLSSPVTGWIAAGTCVGDFVGGTHYCDCYAQARTDSNDCANDCRNWHCTDTVAEDGWVPVTLYSPFTDKLDTRWTVITDEQSQIHTLEMHLRELREGMSDVVVKDWTVVQQDGTYIDAVAVTQAELSFAMEGLNLPQAANLVVSLRATNHAALVSIIGTTTIRVDATVPDTSNAVVQILPQPAVTHSQQSLFSGSTNGVLAECKQSTTASDTTSAQPSTSWLRPKLARDSGFAGCHPDPDDSVNANNPHPVQTSLQRIVVEWSGFAEDAYSGIDHYEWALGGCDPAVGNYPQTGGFLNVGLALGADADVNLVAGTSYCVTVKVFNLAGLFSLKMSPPVLVDDAPPLAGWVNDGFDVTVAHLHFDRRVVLRRLVHNLRGQPCGWRLVGGSLGTSAAAQQGGEGR